jgi:hypothetical protein
MNSEKDVQSEGAERENLVPMFIRLTPAAHQALKEESRMNKVPISVLIRQVIAAWLDSRPPDFKRAA